MVTLCVAASKPILRLSQRKAFVSLSSRAIFTTNTVAPPRSHFFTGFYRTAFVLSAGLFAVYYFDARSAIHRYFLTPLLRYTLDAETGHKVAVKVLRSGLGPRDPLSDNERLASEVRYTTRNISDMLTWAVHESYGAIRYQIQWAWQLVSIKMAKLLTVRSNISFQTCPLSNKIQDSLILDSAGWRLEALHRNLR